MRSLIGRAPLNHTDLYWLFAEAFRLSVVEPSGIVAGSAAPMLPSRVMCTLAGAPSVE